MENSDNDVGQVTEHGPNCKKRLTKLGGQQALDHTKLTIRKLQLQFSLESNLGQSRNMERSKQSEPSKHEGES